MTNLEEIIEQYPDEEILKADGFDNCILGYEYNWDGNIRLIYSVKAMLEELVVSEGMTELDALEHFEYNIRGGYVGEKTPIWCQDDF